MRFGIVLTSTILLVACGAAMAQIKEGDAVRDGLYKETWRPQFHFTAQKNWLNDPNGLVFYKGEYHLFFQHNPVGREWGNMNWGHAVSTDLTHWKELPIAISPDDLGTVFSGSAIVDENNVTGLQKGDEKTLVAFYTAATVPEKPDGPKFSQCMAYSTDRGRTFTKYAKNPVLPHIIGGNRDPKVIWHAPTKKYVMALFKDQHTYAFFGSTTLTEWEWLSDYEFPNVGECPDLFELPVEGAPGETRWIFVSGNGSYFVGVFDGTKFTPESGPFPGDYGANFYATQSYSGIPASDGRRIQIAWMNGGKYPDMAFNQQMSYPCALTLKRFPEGLIVCRQPVREIEKIYAGAQVIEHKDLNATDNPLSGVAGDLFSVRVTLAVSEDVKVVLRLRDADIVWTGKDKTLSCLGKSAPLSPVDGHIVLQGLLDRASLEVFGNDGRVSMSTCFLPKAEEKGLSLKAEQGKAVAERIEIHPLRSAWEQ